MGAGDSGGSGGLASLFSSLFGLIGFAEGGKTPAGQAFMVGEKGPEILSFNKPGFVTPNRALRSVAQRSGGDVHHHTTVNMNINGVHDSDSFRRSQSQIYAGMHAQLALANSRNG